MHRHSVVHFCNLQLGQRGCDPLRTDGLRGHLWRHHRRSLQPSGHYRCVHIARRVRQRLALHAPDHLVPVRGWLCGHRPQLRWQLQLPRLIYTRPGSEESLHQNFRQLGRRSGLEYGCGRDTERDLMHFPLRLSHPHGEGQAHRW